MGVLGVFLLSCALAIAAGALWLRLGRLRAEERDRLMRAHLWRQYGPRL